MKRKTVMAAGLMAALAMAPVAKAALVVSNGDFETGTGNNIDSVTGWNDPSDGTFWHGAWSTSNTGISPNDTGVVVLGSFEGGAIQNTASADVDAGNYLYQSIGTADGLTSLQISFDLGDPDDNNGTRSLGMSVGIYAYDGLGGFTADNNTDVRGASGISLLDVTQQFTMTGTSTDNEINTLSATFDISAAGSQELFLRFNNYRPGATESWAVLDNIQIIPEPATLGLVGVFGAGVLFVRRRFMI